ncbi:15855_t:CDS:2 [Racocetra fulgida]|uniref:15855_t:CDS:1 n=1 Tax=Racocetra fulgida TaxID=60492 RepID=A0A9N8VTQ2_9GLOM|nr:15855_t:CDS:2 [Racocetra fulgida]
MQVANKDNDNLTEDVMQIVNDNNNQNDNSTVHVMQVANKDNDNLTEDMMQIIKDSNKK